MRYFIGFLLLFGNPLLHAQLHDYNWMMGYSGGEGTDTSNDFGLVRLAFAGERLEVIDQQAFGEAYFWENNVTYSDDEGQLFCYYDGQNIYNRQHLIMDGGANWLESDYSTGWISAQSGLIISIPNSDSLLAFLNTQINNFEFPASGSSIAGENLYYSIINKNQNDGLGAVILRREQILEDTLDYGKLSACRHANGRDWWVIAARHTLNEFHRFLLTPIGVEYIGAQKIGDELPIGGGQAFFSPNGKKHIRYNSVSNAVGDHLTIYEFDRCTGLFDNYVKIILDIPALRGGGAVSRNSKYLYTASGNFLYQYDLLDSNLLETQNVVANYDGFIDFNPTTFYLSQLGPDGKIYICGGLSNRFMHVIHNPGAPFPDCRIEQRGLELPTFNLGSVPNYPNYRLGPIDGSPCDTLGIDNLPLSRWRYEQNTLTPFTVQFYDLSDYEPATWSWDFGEGSSSMDTLPAHTFPGPGTYEVCLTVSNANGSDTKCKTLEFTEPVTVSQQVETAPLATAFPNPFRKRFSLSLRAGWLPVQANAVVYDVMGRPVLTQRLSAGFNTLDLSGHPAGVYTWRLEEQGRVLEVGKVVKIGNR